VELWSCGVVDYRQAVESRAVQSWSPAPWSLGLWSRRVVDYRQVKSWSLEYRRVVESGVTEQRSSGVVE